MVWFTRKRRLSTARLTGKRADVWQKTDGRCGYCGRPLDPESFHVDHVVPRALGGSDDLANLVACCIRDNLRKGKRSLEEFRAAEETRLGMNTRWHARWRRLRHRFYFEKKGLKIGIAVARNVTPGRSPRRRRAAGGI